MLAALALSTFLSAPPVAQQSAPSLEHAIHLIGNFEDARGVAELRQLLALKPPMRVAARAHLYLGLVAFDAHDPDTTQQEFREAVHLDPSIEIPEASPKARLALEEARGAVMKELSNEPAPPRPAPAAALTAPVPESTRPPESHSHALALTLGGAAAVAAAFAIVGAGEVAGFDSTMTAAQAHTLTPQESYTVAAGQQSSAQTWQAVGIVCAVAAAAGAAGAILTW